jgi:NADH-quinone oxidoreductase subunit J
MSDLLFHLFALLTVAFALGVVFNKNAVASALCFLLSLMGVAGLFVLLDAFLLAVLLVLVYAGAVVALFLFIIMLLDMQGGDRKRFTKATILSSTVAAGLLVTGLVSFASNGLVETADPAAVKVVGSSLRAYAEQLFTVYLLPVQIVGFLLLIAMLGVIVLSKKFEGLEDVKEVTAPYPPPTPRSLLLASAMSPLPLAALSGPFAVTLNAYLYLAAVLFAVGFFGVLLRKNTLVIYMCLELMLVASTVALVAFSRYNGVLDGNVFVFFILTVAAAEVAVGLAIIVALFRRRQTVQVEELNALKN